MSSWFWLLLWGPQLSTLWKSDPSDKIKQPPPPCTRLQFHCKRAQTLIVRLHLLSDKYPWERYELPHPHPSYGLNSTASVLQQKGIWYQIKQVFFQVVAVSVLLYGCTSWKCWEKKLDVIYTRMFQKNPGSSTLQNSSLFVLLLNGISTFLGYLMLNPFFLLKGQ